MKNGGSSYDRSVPPPVILIPTKENPITIAPIHIARVIDELEFIYQRFLGTILKPTFVFPRKTLTLPICHVT